MVVWRCMRVLRVCGYGKIYQGPTKVVDCGLSTKNDGKTYEFLIFSKENDDMMPCYL